jgi:hypothetical protein
MRLLKTRNIKEEDYNMLLSWWKWHRFPAPKKQMLPDNGLGGIIIQDEGIDICAGFLYLTNSKLCWLEYIVSNPEYKNKENRKIAISLTIKRLCEIAKEIGYEAVFTSVKNPHLISQFESFGFSKDNATEMALKL